jgi:hypothetical protein
MTTGASGTYSINSTNFILQPSEDSGWSQRMSVGTDGDGRPVYPAYREFTITWELMHPADFQQIKNAYDAVANTGSVAFDLPEYGAADFTFKTYSGCVIEEPAIGKYFNGYIKGATLLIAKIRT